MADLQDKTLVCVDCGSAFTWTAAEQQFYKDKGFDNEPKRCPEDRQKHKMQRTGFGGGQRQMYEITCSQCGKKDTVPFEPRGDRPVFCREHFQSQRRTSA